MTRALPALAVLCLLMACGGAPDAAGGGAGAGSERRLAAALQDRAPEPGAPGCWHSETLPALFETETRQTLVTRPDGRSSTEIATRQRMIRPRSTIWYEIPCPDSQTPAFVATLQRALKARGLFDMAVSGVADRDTAEAIRRFQAPRGLDSEILSLAAARELGIVARPLDGL